MTEENMNDNDIISNSIDFLSDRQNKRLEIIIEEKNSSNKDKTNAEENENKTQFNFNKVSNPLVDIEQPKRANSCEKRKKNKILQKKLKEILDYRAKFKSLEEEENLKEEELNKEENEKKKKVETKVNRNLKLLNLIKEKMNQNEIKDEIKKEDNNENIINNDLNKNIVEEKKENIIDNNNKNENNDNEINKISDKNEINEEKRKKLLKLFDKNKEKKENENNDKISGGYAIKNEEKENIKEDENNNVMNKEKEIDNNKYQKIKIPHPNVGSVSYPTFMKKGTGNFRIQTPKSKQQNKKILTKSNSNEKEQNNNSNIINKDNIEKDNKFSDIPIEQKNKLTINIKPKNIVFTQDNSNQNSDTKEEKDLNDNIISLSNKKEEKSISNNKSNNNKKGALKILELLKAKKKEQNENEKKEKNEEEEDNEQIIDSKNINEYGSSLFNQEKEEVKKIINIDNINDEALLDANSLPKKKFKEEDEENNFKKKDNYNKSQHVFRKANKNNIQSDNFNKNNNITNNTKIKTNYFNNINNNINNYFNIGETPNYPERKTLEYINNANLIRNKLNKRMKAFNTTNQYLDQDNDDDLEDDIFRVGNNSQLNYINQKNSMIENHNNLSTKNLDKSYDMLKTRKSPIPKREIEKNILSNINGPKTIKNINNNKYIKYGPYERNTANSFQRNGKIYNKIKYKRNTPRNAPAYVKKSPGKINIINSRENNCIPNKINIDNNKYKPVQNKYNKNNINNINNKNFNFDNNEGIEISTIYKLNSSIDSSISNRTNNKKVKENTMLFNLEDLLVLEERLNNITLALEANKSVESQCFNFWNYYFNCSLYKILEKIFQNEEDSNIVRLSINYELMSVMVCYDFAFGNDVDDEDLNLSLIELIYFNHNNLMIICEYILTKISPENTDNIWVLKLQEIVKNSKFSQSKEIKTNNQTTYHVQKILNNTNKIIKKIKSLLLNYQTDSSSLLKNFILNLPNKTYSEINNFFRSQILRIDNYEGSLVPPSYFKKNRDFTPLPAPYLQYKTTKPYTLILDLDETLVSFQIKSKKEGTLRARPFLFAFLEEMGHYYELVVWTSATEAYANSLIDAIEYDKQYFDFILFREHAIIIGDEFVKDLNRVGRGLDKIIIVDDMPQNFRLQKQNGITIKPFFGDDYKDTALYDLLPILKHIAEEGNDVRIELAKYREEIVKKITSNIS